MMNRNVPNEATATTQQAREGVLDLWDSLGCDAALKRGDWFQSESRRMLLEAFQDARERRSLR